MELDDGVGGTIALAAPWPALWNFYHSRRLIDVAPHSANRFSDEFVVTGPGLYRREPVVAAPGGRR